MVLSGKIYDVVIVGGGILGLWTARLAVQAGLSVALVDKATCGSGASATVLGALLPHLPRVMASKKKFQFEALAELSGLVDQLEEETGVDAGYVRCGRIMPIRTPRYLEHARAACIGSQEHWNTPASGFQVEVRETATLEGWIDPQAAPLGLIYDNLSARFLTRKYTSALTASLKGRADIFEEMEVFAVDTARGELVGPTGNLGVRGREIIFAAGHETFPLIHRMLGLELGAGIKGQAAVFALLTENACPPVIYDNGVYIVPHGRGRCAVGSTSDDTFDDPTTPDPAKAEGFIEQAKALCPPLRDGELLHHWAGVRPRCTSKDPIVGCLDPERHLHVITGGYKITLGIAHRVARRLVEEITDAAHRTEIPETYEVAYHLNSMRR